MSSFIYNSDNVRQYLVNNVLIYNRLSSRKYLMLIFVLSLLTNICASTTLHESTNFPIYMVKLPESAIAPQGDEVQFECELNLEPEKLEWRFRPQDSTIDQDSFININRNSGYNVTKTGKLSQLHVYVNQKTVGDYECVAWFGASAITSIPAKLMLASISLDNSRRNVQNQVAHYKISPNNSVIIKCGDVISYPPPVWSYYKDNVLVPGNATQISTGGLVLSKLTKEDSGTYTCTAVNSILGIEIKLPQKVTILVDYTPRSPPTFLIEPPKTITTRPGETVLLECSGIGNPAPKPVWSRPDGRIDSTRSTIYGYGLMIRDAKPEDQGTYNCRLDNGMSKILDHSVFLTVLEFPKIIEGPKDTLTNETDSLELECKANGSPTPDIYWKINGHNTKWDPLITSKGNKLSIHSIEKRHAGIVQCFARNEMGETSAANQLRVNPKSIPGEVGAYGSYPLGIIPHTSRSNEHFMKPTKTRKKNKNPIMVPPSRPNVSRLTDQSVMVRWSVPQNDGLPIQFFKVQYRLLGDPSKKVGRSQWKTANEDIPPNVRSYSIEDLKADHIYRFRIAAVYSNNDNKLSATSAKFHLLRASQLGPTKSHLSPANLTHIESLSETELVIHWTFPNNPSQTVEGFYVYYRPSTTAGEYLKLTVESQSLRHFKIDNLEPGTSYEFKIQSFTSAAASEFSAILTGRTKKIPTSPPTTPSVVVTQKSVSRTSSFIPIVIGGLLGLAILSLGAIIACIALKKRKLTIEDESANKPHPDHMQVEANGFVGTGHKLNSPTLKHNGVLPRMTITNNPLAQDEKNRNIMELQSLPNSNLKATIDVAIIANGLSSSNDTTITSDNNCCDPPLSSQNDKKNQNQNQQHNQATNNLPTVITPPTLGIPTVPNNHPHNHHNHHNKHNNNNNHHHHNNSHHGHHQQATANNSVPPLPPHRNTLERNHNRNNNNNTNNNNNVNHYNVNQNHQQNHKIYPKNNIHHSNFNNHNNNNNNKNNSYHNNHQQYAHNLDSSEKVMSDGDCGLPIVRSVSIPHRQYRHGSNNSVNGSPRITRGSSSELLHNNRQQQYQHPHLTIRGSKRLNSIEV